VWVTLHDLYVAARIQVLVSLVENLLVGVQYAKEEEVERRGEDTLSWLDIQAAEDA
jgi:hypothetical protein